MDSTGIKVEGEGEWNASKHGGPKQRVWRKIHLGIDEQTLEIRAVHCPAGMLPGGEITGSHIGDAPVLPDLLRQIPADEKTGSVTADGAYDTRKCHDAIADRGDHAVIPPRKNASRGRPSQPVQWRATTPCGQANTWVERSGGDGADTTAKAASRPRCTA